jgi:hypothetical protein
VSPEEGWPTSENREFSEVRQEFIVDHRFCVEWPLGDRALRKQGELEGITISRIEGGEMVEDWDSYDNLSMLQQLGFAPEQ